MSHAPATVTIRRWFRSRTAILIVFTIALFLFVYPVVMLIIGAFRNADPTLPAQWGVQSFVDVYTSPRTYTAFGSSLLLATVSTALSVMFAIYMAFLSARTRTPLRGLITPAMVVVLALPPTFFAISWGMLGNPRVGTLNQLLAAVMGNDVSVFNVNSWAGIILVSALHKSAITYLLLIGPFMALDRSLEEAAQVAGAGGLRTFFGVDLPVLAPTITGVTILSFVKGLETFDIPLLLGTPVGIRVVATEIYGEISNNIPPNYGGASALSTTLLLVVIILVLVQWRILGKRKFVTVTGKSFRTDRWDIKGWKFVGTGVIALYLIAAVILPGLQLVYGALQPYFGAGFGNLTTRHVESALTSPELLDAIGLTLWLAGACGLIAATFCAVAAHLSARSNSRLAKLTELSLWLPWAVPGVVLSLAFAWAFLAVPGLRSLYGTPWILMLALAVSAVPVAMRPVQGAIAQISAELEDAARSYGASRARMFFTIVLRIIAPSFLAAWFVAAILVSGNLAVPTLLSGLGNQTVPMIVFQLYSEGHVTESAGLLLVHLTVTFVVLGTIWLLFRGLSLFAARRLPASGSPMAPSPGPRMEDADESAELVAGVSR